MEKVLRQFRLEGRPLSCERYGEGHINRTYLVVTDAPRRYILQRVSRAAFHNIPALMGNIAAVTAFLAAQSDDPRGSLHLVPTVDGALWYLDSEGEYWRVYAFLSAASPWPGLMMRVMVATMPAASATSAGIITLLPVLASLPNSAM